MWLKTNSLYNQITTSFIQSKLVTHVKKNKYLFCFFEIITFFSKVTDIELNPSSRSKTSNERAPLTGISDIDEPIYEVNYI